MSIEDIYYFKNAYLDFFNRTCQKYVGIYGQRIRDAQNYKDKLRILYEIV